MASEGSSTITDRFCDSQPGLDARILANAVSLVARQSVFQTIKSVIADNAMTVLVILHNEPSILYGELVGR